MVQRHRHLAQKFPLHHPCRALAAHLVLVEQQATAENGEKIVALVNDSATVKTFYKEDGYFRLQPENDEMDPILVNDLQIVGKVIGVLRFLS